MNVEDLKRDAWTLRQKIDAVKNPIKKARLMKEYAMLINALEASPSYVVDVTYEYSELTIVRLEDVRYHLLGLAYSVLRKLKML